MNAIRSFFELDKYHTSCHAGDCRTDHVYHHVIHRGGEHRAILRYAGFRGTKFHGNHCGCGFRLHPDGLSANRPFAIAPYMVDALSHSPYAFNSATSGDQHWAQFSLPAFYSLFSPCLRLRQWVVDSVPLSLRYSFAVGIGLFLTFIGLNQTGNRRRWVWLALHFRAGHLNSAPVLVAIFGFFCFQCW